MSKIHLFKVFAFLCAIIVASCSSSDKDKYKGDPKWIGKSKQALIDAYGLPNETLDSENGGKVFVYSKKVSAKVHETNEKKSYVRKRLFYLDASGNIYQFKEE